MDDIEHLRNSLDWARNISSMVTAAKSALQSWERTATIANRSMEALTRDWAKDFSSMVTAAESTKAGWVLDITPVSKTFRVGEAHNLQIASAWVESFPLEKIEPARVEFYPSTQIQQPNNRLSLKPFSDYGMAESYDLLSSFERGLRPFIHQRMVAAFGSKWEKSRIPAEMYARWLEKRERAILVGEPPEPLIDYADFTDYVIVITRKDNWEQVFKEFFVRSQFIQESLYRLYPIRVRMMHSRPLSQEMRLLLQSEIRLLSKRIWS